MKQVIEQTIGPEVPSGRADKVLADLGGWSRTRVQAWIEAGCVRVKGRPLSRRETLKPGMVVQIEIPALEPTDLQPEDAPLDIVYEDSWLLVLNKSPGVVVHPGAGHPTGTLVAAVLHHCQGMLSGIGGRERPGVVHRLDKDTSGLIVMAKDDLSHQSLSAQFSGRMVEKVYQAWVVRGPVADSGSWKGAIARHPVHRQKMTVTQVGGRPAWTDFKVTKRLAHAALLEFQLHTGRTHQIRVHCAHAGCPVVGDMLYGKKVKWPGDFVVPRQLLHAWRLAFVHPGLNKRVEFTAPIPDDFKRFESAISHLA